MIKKYNNFLLEDFYDDGYYSNTSQMISRYKNFIKKLRGEEDSKPSSSDNDDDDDYDDDDDESTSYVKPKSFQNVDEMIRIIVKYLNKYGITNPYIQKGILSTIAKESAFTSTREAPYTTTSPARIREVFGARVANMSDQEINDLKKKENEFWEKVYGGEWGAKYLGNTQPGEGAKYVGRGFNGITGKANYKRMTDLLKGFGKNVDLVSNPETLEKDPELTAEVNAIYFLNALDHPLIKRKYGNKDANDFSNFDTALRAAVNATAGAGVDINKGFAMQSYKNAVAASTNLGSKFDKAISGPSDANRTA